MRNVAESLQAQLDHKAIRLRLLPTSNLDVFFGDGEEIRRALVDLLLDAIDSTSASQAITFAAFQRGRETVFKITDRGGGVDKRRAKARKFVEDNGGVMHVDAVSGEGATITCIFSSPVLDAETQGGDRAS